MNTPEGVELTNKMTERAWELAAFHSLTRENGLTLDGMSDDQREAIEFGIYVGIHACIELLEEHGLLNTTRKAP